MESDRLMKNWSNRYSRIAVLFVFLMAFLVPNASANTDVIRYLALGDSLAAGVTPTKELGKGYADFAKESLEAEKLLGSYSKNFAVPGEKTDELLKKLMENTELQQAVKQSNTITISSGANDLLRESKLDPEKKILLIDETKIPGVLKNIATNYASILTVIKNLNPDAKVYVMGYYYSFPYIADIQKPKLIELTKALNQTIQLTSSTMGATFVPVYELFGEDPKQFLPNPTDIHPNAAGYQLMSTAFLGSLATATAVAKDLPTGHWAEKEIKALLASKLYQLDDKGNIYPEKSITRAEVANILFGLIPLTKSIPADPGFKDVPQTHPSYMAIAKLTEVDIFTKNTLFNPDAPLTRVQLAKVASIAFGLKGDGSLPSYKDINNSYWGTSFIDAVTSNNIMVGYKNGYFGLHDATSRAQFAVVLSRIQAHATSH